jgi:hypothetical protein
VSTLPRSTLSRPEPTPTDCRHSREPFDTAFRVVMERTDLSANAKLVHARLVSQHRMGASWTQIEIGEGAGLSRHQVWRATAELVAAGLLTVIRHGQGRPSSYVLLGIEDADLDGRASRRPAPGIRVPADRAHSRAGTYSPKRTTEEPGYIQPGRNYGYTQPPRSGSLLVSRYGPVAPRG